MSENYSLSEQETNINYDRSESLATVFTANPAVVRKLDKLMASRGNEMILVHKTIATRTYQIPKKWVKIRPSMIISEEKRKELSERGKLAMKKLRQKT